MIDAGSEELETVLGKELARRKAAGLYRERVAVEGPQGTEISIGGRRLLSFCSNDYLGLCNHEAVRRAFMRAADRYGTGTGASHLITGHTAAHHELEQDLAAFTGRESALLFSTGYMANLGVVTALTDRNDEIFADRLNHASLVDACRLSRAKLKRYRHADADQLRELMGERPGGRRLVVTDGVFSMDGDRAPLARMAEEAAAGSAWLMVDDAHGFGVLGEHGGGLLEEAGLDTHEVPVLMATLGKAAGVAGAFVAGPAELIETLVQSARSYVYTTAMPAALAEAARAALGIIRAESWRREKLLSLIARFRDGMRDLDLETGASTTPIQPVLYGGADDAVRASRRLLEAGIMVPAIRPPTVPEGSARLRITFSCEHTEQQVDRLLDALAGTRTPHVRPA